MTTRDRLLSASDRRAALASKLRIHGLYDCAVALAVSWRLSLEDLFHARHRSAVGARIAFSAKLRALGWTDARIGPFLGLLPLNHVTRASS